MSGLSAPLVSIGIPTYNRAAELPRAIESALRQDYANIELIVSDNASADGTEQLCREISARESRVRYIRRPVNQGPSENFRLVLTEARGPFFMWLGDDDWLDADYVARCVDALRSDTGYSLVSGAARYYAGERLVAEGEPFDLSMASAADRVLGYFRTVGRNGVFYGLMRRELILEAFRPACLGDDWLMVAAMAQTGKIRTLESTHVNRSVSGQSAEMGSLVGLYRLSEFQKANPYLTIAGSVFADIGWRSPLYQTLGSAARLTLAARAAAIVIQRHHPRGLIGTIPTAVRAVYGSR